MYGLFNALNHRFDDKDEVSDISRYGCSGGVSDFIYTTEIDAFFDEFEDELLDYCDDAGLDWTYMCRNTECMSDIKRQYVWAAVELYCHHQMDILESAEMEVV